MVLYHLDRSLSLKENQIIAYGDGSTNLFHDFDSRVSAFGARMLDTPSKMQNGMALEAITSLLNDYNLEINAEKLRELYFPAMPSRLSVLFGVKQISDLFAWDEFFHIDGESKICEIEYSGPLYELDARYLRGKAINDVYVQETQEMVKERTNHMIENLMMYWGQRVSDFPLMEVLIPLPVKVLRCTRLNEYPEFRSLERGHI